MSDFDTLHEQAVALRRAGKSRRQIKETLGVTHNGDLTRLLGDEPPPVWTRRPNAKDDLRDRARELRAEGWSYPDIAAELGVSKSSVSLWVRDVSIPARDSRIPVRGPRHHQRSASGEARRLAALRKARQVKNRRSRIQRQQTKFYAAKEVGDLDKRDILLLGAMAYWCEGSKDKPYRRQEHVDFINSDPRLVSFFVRFLDVLGVEHERLRLTVHIHETGDLAAATRYWAELVGFDDSSFNKPVIKRHKVNTNRKNTGEDYRGCLEISVRKSAELYRRIEGWALGAMLAPSQENETSPPPAPPIDLSDFIWECRSLAKANCPN